MKKDGPKCNCFVIRPSSNIISFDDCRLLVAYRMGRWHA